MAEEVENQESQDEQAESEQLGGGAYDVIRNRLQQQNNELMKRVDQLNTKRKEAFGGQESTIIGNERIQTENNCVPRDIFSTGNTLIFGYNVQMGLRTQIKLEDVFSIHEFADGQFQTLGYDIIGDENFLRHFLELYKYYSSARFLQFVRTPTKLLMLFQIGETTENVKVFRWTINPDNTLTYIDDRGDSDYSIPPQQAFKWTLTTRDDQVTGRHPHVSIMNKVYVETLGGDLTIKVDNNTEVGEGIYSEEVQNPDQTLDDAEVYYAQVGNLILLKILPYQEKDYRYIVFNEKTQRAVRIDSIGSACIELPEDHGIIFPKGYYLQDGTTRLFQDDVAGMRFQEIKRSPNGEDFLYIFYHPEQGRYILLKYNLITKEVDNPIFCHGSTLFDDGQMVMFNNPDDEPKRVHAMQIWQTTFHADTYEVVKDTTPTYLDKIGNRDLVKGISDCYAISRLINSENVTIHTYQDLVITCNNTLDSYHWLGQDECFNLRESVLQIKQTGIAAVDEYEKVVGIREETERRLTENEKQVTKAIKDAQYGSKRSVNDFVDAINELRSRRGQVISLRELKYVDQSRVDTMEQSLAGTTEELSMGCVEFLLKDNAMDPYYANIKEVDTDLGKVEKVADIKLIEEKITDLAGRLDLLTDVVNNLQIDDSTKTTTIVDSITEVYGQVNRVKALARNLRKDLGKGEASAEFAAQFKLVTQSITNYIGLCDTPEKCDELMTKTMISIEELEGKFADYDEYIEQLTEKREEAYTAFTNRKQILEEEVKRKVGSLISSAERILKGVRNRAGTLKSLDEVNSYFASDLMISKLREITEKLQASGNSVQSDDLVGQLKSLREETVRKLRDKLELFADGDNVITFGDYKFNINTQPLNLTTVFREGDMYFHLTGTDYYELVDDPEFLSTKNIWDQELVSENRDVYRAEYLAYKMLIAGIRGFSGLTVKSLTAAGKADDDTLLNMVRDFSANLYTEGYDKGIHDLDATAILREIVSLYNTSDLLRYDSSSRAFAIIFWAYYENEQHKHFIRSKVRSFGTIGQVFDVEEVNRTYIDELHAAMRDFYAELVPDANPAAISNAAEFLFYELQDQEELLFTINKLANDLYQRFVLKVKEKKIYERFISDVKALDGDLKGRLDLVRDWVTTYCRMHEDGDTSLLIWEVIALIVTGDDVEKEVAQFSTYVKVEDLLGQHSLIEDKCLDIYFDQFLLKMTDFVQDKVPRFEKYTDMRTELTLERREGMRLSEFEPKVMGSFVRNRLINNVYMNLVGANFAKQMGVAGENKRTDLMGLLMLISPPGYGKTTLMEYISNRLGLTFMKINGPAIGHQVTSLDPSEAPNATAREELYKLNLSLEMGNNVMIYLDDIQHVNPEFLQKFISLCDAQRKIEGVYKGKTKTYDLRGKKVAVVMAGNPYTESGEKFQIPDMLANRADTYNLGDVSSTAADDFALSFVENAMTSNPVLSQIASRSHADLYRFWQLLENDSREGIDFDYNWSTAEETEILNVLGKLKHVQQTVLSVNSQYIASAAQADEYRTEPPFKLQGSYRNMCRMAEKVQPVMTDEEVHQVIVDHYINEAQTLTSGAESNLLKFKELCGTLTETELNRWNEIKKEFNRRQTFAGVDDGDQIGQIIAQISAFTGKVDTIGEVLDKSLNGSVRDALQGINFEPLVSALENLKSDGGSKVDLSPVVNALSNIKFNQPEAAAEPVTIDVQPITHAIETFSSENTRHLEDDQKFRKDFSKVCERQITAIELMLPIIESVKIQNDTFSNLRELLEQILEGVIEVKVKQQSAAKTSKPAKK